MRRSTVGTRFLGAAALAGVVGMLVCVFFRYGVARPRWDIIALAALTLVLAAGWVLAGRQAPEADPAGPPPGDAPPIPADLGRPRRPWPLAAGALLVLWALVALWAVAWLPHGADQKVVNAVQRHGPVVAQGTVVEPPTHLEVLDDGKVTTRVTGPDGRRAYRTTHHTPLWQADLVMDVPGPHGTERIHVERAHVLQRPDQGDQLSVLYAPSRPDLGGRVDDMQNLASFIRTWSSPGLFWLVLLAFAAVAAALGTVAAPGDLFDKEVRRLRADAAAGRLNAARAWIGDAVWDRAQPGSPDQTPPTWWLELRLADRTLTFKSVHRWNSVAHRELLGVSRRYRGQAGWLCWPLGFEDDETGFVRVALVLDDGQTVWGLVTVTKDPDDYSDPDLRLPRSEQATTPGRPVRPLSGFSRYTPALHLPMLAALTAAFLAVLPVLLHPAGEIVADALCLLAVALVVTATVLVQRRHGAPNPGASGWTVRNRRRTGRQLH